MEAWRSDLLISSIGKLRTSSDHNKVSTLSIVFILSIMLNKSSVNLNKQKHRMSKLPETWETKVIPSILDIFCATKLE